MPRGSLETLLVLGGTGQIGSALCREFADVAVVAPSSAELPIESSAAFEAALERVRPDLVVNCTAYHQLDQCEANPDRAFLINALALGAAAHACARRGVGFVTIGTDYVFSGESDRPYTEADREGPLNVYGISKLAGERYAAIANPATIVFRVSGVFGPSGFSNKGPTFVERMISMAERNEPIRVVDNIRFSPSYAPDVARTMRAVIEGETSGLFHVTNAGSCSWFELASESLRAAGFERAIERTQYSNDGAAVKRPMNSSLEHAELRRRGYASPPPWQSAVAAYVAERAARNSPLKT
jgi:dTDP-4-dehydrorhamnose reductase